MPLRNPNIRTIIAFVHDIAAADIAWWLAYLFRFNFDIPPPVSDIAEGDSAMAGTNTRGGIPLVWSISRALALRQPARFKTDPVRGAGIGGCGAGDPVHGAKT